MRHSASLMRHIIFSMCFAIKLMRHMRHINLFKKIYTILLNNWM